MPSFDPAFLDRLTLTHDVASTLRAIGEGKGQQELFRQRAPDLLENLRMRGPFTVSELHGHCPSVGVDMVRRVLRAERDAERLAVTGTGRGARWMRLPTEGGDG